jgi:hypothetical protein
MAIHRVFAAIEHWPLSIWMREDAYAYFVALIFHAFGMALLVGAGIVISLRFLGAARDSNLRRYRGFHVVMWLGAALAIVSGLLLLCAYPAKALTNPVFAVKLASLLAAALLVRAMAAATPDSVRDPQPTSRSRALAGLALALWLIGVAAGKLLLHTYSVLTVS